MTYQSIVKPMGRVSFPAFKGERIYMHPFLQSSGLPDSLSRWQPTVDAMLEGIETDQTIYLMIDQGHVQAGMPQRRPGVHLDGYWLADKKAHGGGRHVSGAEWDHERRWNTCDFTKPEAIILASNVPACRAYEGAYDGLIGEGGDCSHLDVSHMRAVDMQVGIAYVGNVAMLHESRPVPFDCDRTLVRLSVPGWTP